MLLVNTAARSQYVGTCPAVPHTDQPGGFTLSVTQGCAPLTVRVMSTDRAVANEKYWFNYQGADVANKTAFNPDRVASARTDTTYTKPGRYVILQFGSKGGTASLACQMVEVKATPKPRFQAVACPSGVVAVSIPPHPENGYDAYDITWAEGEAPQRVTSGSTTYHAYAGSGTATLRVKGVYTGLNCGSTADTTLTLVPGTEPAPLLSRLEVSGPAALSLTVTGQPSGTYTVQQTTREGAIERVVTHLNVGATGSTTQALTLPDAERTQRCFRVATPAQCPQPVASPVLCSLPLSVRAENRYNVLEWTAHPRTGLQAPFGGYTVLKNGASFRVLNEVSLVALTDAQVRCTQTDEYQLVARVGSMTSLSLRRRITAVDSLTPPKLTNVYATVHGSRTTLTWLAGPQEANEYRVQWSGRGAGFQEIGRTAEFRFDDTAHSADAPRCYTVSYQNLCGSLAAPSDPVCPVVLSQRGNLLGWTPYQDFPEGLQEYAVEQLDEAGNTLQTVPVGTETSFLPNFDNIPGQVVRYRVRARSAGGYRSTSNVLTVQLALKLFVPDAFSPNGDGLNDTFKPVGAFVESFRLTVFNRWGAPVFRTDDLETGWDGRINGQPADEGPYVYQMDVRDSRGETYVKRGTVRLMR